MLSRARAILTSEIALSEKLEEEAQRLLDVNLGYEQLSQATEASCSGS